TATPTIFILVHATATTELLPVSLHDALPILLAIRPLAVCFNGKSIYEAFSGRRNFTFGLQPETLEGILLFVVPSSSARTAAYQRSEEHTSELQSLRHLVCRLLLEKKKPIHLP